MLFSIFIWLIHLVCVNACLCNVLLMWHLFSFLPSPPQGCLQISLVLCLMQDINHLSRRKWFLIKGKETFYYLFILLLFPGKDPDLQ